MLICILGCKLHEVFAFDSFKEHWSGTSQWSRGLRLHTLNAGGPSVIPGQGTISHVLQLILRVPQLKILHAEVKMTVHMPQLRPSATTTKKEH